MLVTRRKQGESILIGESVEVTVLEIGQGRVKLGVKAPPQVVVERKELRLVGDQNRNAVASAGSVFVQEILESRRKGGPAPAFRLGASLGEQPAPKEAGNPPGDTGAEDSSLS